MSEPSTKVELIQAMIAARTQFDSLFSQIPRSKLLQRGAAGEWSVKDILAHLTAYDRWLGLGLALRSQKPPDLWIEDLPLDEFNRRLYEQNRDLPLDQVLQEFGDVWNEMLEETRLRSEAYLFAEQSVSGVPYNFKPCDILKSESYGHYLDHVPSLMAWMAAIK